MLRLTGQHSSHHQFANKQLLPFAFDEGQRRFHVQNSHQYSKNRCHCYYNCFVLVVFLQIVNLEEWVFENFFFDILCQVFNLFICSSSVSGDPKF